MHSVFVVHATQFHIIYTNKCKCIEENICNFLCNHQLTQPLKKVIFKKHCEDGLSCSGRVSWIRIIQNFNLFKRQKDRQQTCRNRDIGVTFPFQISSYCVSFPPEVVVVCISRKAISESWSHFLLVKENIKQISLQD